MTIEEAIERNQQRIANLNDTYRQKMRLYQTGVTSKEQHNGEQSAINKERLATQLGIEALKRVKANRKGPIVVVYKELPGETEK